MDHLLIYLRSPAGDDAMAQRTRIVQRNLRNVLDLVDGKRSVAEIIRKFGDVSIAEAALADLERSGFIETPEGRRAREAAAAEGPETRPPEGPRSLPPGSGKGKPSLKVEAFGDHFDDEDITIMDPLDFPGMAPPGAPAQGGAPAAGQPPAARARAPWEEDEELAELASGAAPPPDYKPPVFNDDEAAARGQPAERASRPRAPGSWLGRLKIAAAAVVGLVVVVAAVIVFFPYDRYLPRVELNLRSSAGEPVRLGTLRFSFDPQPNITLEKLSFGEDQALSVGIVKAVPEFSTLFSTTKRMREVHLRHVDMDARALPRFAAWINGGVLGSRYFVTRSLRFSDLTLRMGDLVMEGIGGRVLLDAEGRVSAVHFANAEGNLKGELAPGGAPQAIRFSASEWSLPSHDWIKLLTLEAEGVIATGGLRIDKFDARAFDGLVAGSVLFNWADGGEFSADVEFKRLSAQQLLAQIRPGFSMKGEIGGKFRFAARSAKVADVTSSVAAEGALEIQRGVLPGLDFAEAVRSRNPGPTRGGQTRFEQLTADFSMSGRDWRLAKLRIDAGLMRANGALTLGERDITGNVQVQFEGASLLRAPVAITGSVADPQLSRR